MKTKLSKQLELNFIYLIIESNWISQIFFVLKKNTNNIKTYINYKKLDNYIILDFINIVLNKVVMDKCVLYINGFLSYN